MIPGFDDLSYPDRLRKLKLPTLAYRRIRGDMIQVYKVMNGFYDPNLPTLLVKSKNDQLRGHDQKLYIKNSNKELIRFSFNNRTARIWNYLPDEIVKSKDIISFEKALDHYWQDQDALYNDFKAKIKIRCKTCKTKINDYCIACEHLENRWFIKKKQSPESPRPTCPEYWAMPHRRTVALPHSYGYYLRG